MPPSELPAYVTAGVRTQGLSAGVAIKGLDEALAFIRLFDSQLLPTTKNIFLQEANIVASDARASAPRVSGNLADSIKTRAIIKTAHVGAKISIGGSKAPYAGVVMFGKKASRPTRHLTPNPFLIRAAERHKVGVAERISSAIQRLLNG